jgi:hypothetical protein
MLLLAYYYILVLFYMFTPASTLFLLVYHYSKIHAYLLVDRFELITDSRYHTLAYVSTFMGR